MPSGFETALSKLFENNIGLCSVVLPVFMVLTYAVWAVVQSLLEEAADSGKRWWNGRDLFGETCPAGTHRNPAPRQARSILRGLSRFTRISRGGCHARRGEAPGLFESG